MTSENPPPEDLLITTRESKPKHVQSFKTCYLYVKCQRKTYETPVWILYEIWNFLSFFFFCLWSIRDCIRKGFFCWKYLYTYAARLWFVFASLESHREVLGARSHDIQRAVELRGLQNYLPHEHGWMRNHEEMTTSHTWIWCRVQKSYYVLCTIVVKSSTLICLFALS